MTDPRAAGRAIVGKILLAASAVMLGVAAMFWFGVVTVGEPARQLVAGALVFAAAVDAFIGLRFLGES